MPDVDVWNKILRGFEVKLAALANVPKIQSPNVDLTPVKGTSFLRSTLLPSQTVPASIGTNGSNLYQGVYQIDIFTPAGVGASAAIALADDLVEHFPRGLVLTTDLFRVRVEASSIQPARSETDWYQIPVLVSWFSFGNN